jgi:hypothetical protein
MWFRVEINSDGSVKSCDFVEGVNIDTRHVFYVEADTKEGALACAAAKYRARLERHSEYCKDRYKERKAKGLCVCGAECVPGKTRCGPCADTGNARQRSYHERLRQNGPARNGRLLDKPDVELAARRQDELRYFRNRDRSKAAMMRLALEKFLVSTPSEYECWLRTTIARCEKFHKKPESVSK